MHKPADPVAMSSPAKLSEQEVLPLLQAWSSLQKRFSPPMDKFHSLTGAMPDCELLAPIYDVWTAYTRMVAQKVGDLSDWLGYFENECKMGSSPHEVSWTNPDGSKEEVMLETLEQLAYILTH